MNRYYYQMNKYYYQLITMYPLADKTCIGIYCQICDTNYSTHIKPFHGFNNHGLVICNNNTCIVSAEEQIDDLFTKYPIYNLNLNRNDIKYNNKIWSTLKLNNDDLYFIEECIGLTYLVDGRMYTILYDEMNVSTLDSCLIFDLKEIYETNDFSDEEIVSFPDLVKEYLGIPFHSIELKFVD